MLTKPPSGVGEGVGVADPSSGGGVGVGVGDGVGAGVCFPGAGVGVAGGRLKRSVHVKPLTSGQVQPCWTWAKG